MPRYPEALPITAARPQILEALASHQVLVVCGDTGSGKTTQLPKLCLEAGRGTNGLIGHTQPRRIAARAVASRLAEELGVKVGREVGLKIRFTDETHASSLIKVMTDGILLNEIRSDRRLEQYDTLIIDEAHERSLNIDFVLGYLKRILRQRPELKLVITSATIDPERFAEHFDGAPILRVEGRSFPVEVRYRAPEPDADIAEAVTAAVRDLDAVDLAELGGGRHKDVLVFLPGERWIRDTEAALRRAGPKHYEVLPLYARLPSARQQRIFEPGAAPRIVLATNVAETSLTVPRIRFVVDSGLARVSRYAARHRIQRLAVEPIARANAVQRAGRCGRLAPGICVRLYSEEDFDARPRFMEPEILRTDLAGVILRLEAMGLGHIDDFPFLDSPPGRAVNDAYRLLHVLGAMRPDGRLTREGRLMGRLPLDPRLARLLLAARRFGSFDEALVLAAALSVIDPREQSADEPETARSAHREFEDPRSDFSTLLNLWRASREARRLGRKRFREWCKAHYLSLPRLIEWHDVHRQLEELVEQFDWRVERRQSDYKRIHLAVLAAFIDFLAQRADGGEYHGMHDAKAALFPGAALAKKKPRWVVAAEHVATGRAYLRTVAQVNPRWAQQAAPHLLKREYLDPAWDARRGRVTAREVVSIFGLVLSAKRRVDFGRVDAAGARRIFIEEALAQDALGADSPVLDHNRRLRAELLDWEARIRSRDLYIGDRGIGAFYDRELPPGVRDRPGFLRWTRKAPNAARLRMRVEDLATRDPGALPESEYPLTIDVAGQSLELTYCYEPGSERDGVTLTLPRLLLDAVRAEALEWLIPGWLEDKVLALLRTLPKARRRALVPLPDTAREILPSLLEQFGQQDLIGAIRQRLAAVRDVALEAEAFEPERLPDYLFMRVVLVDEGGEAIAAGRDVARLQLEYAQPGRRAETVSAAAGPDGWTQKGLTRFSCPDLPDSVPVEQYGRTLYLYPALVDAEGRVDLELLPPGPAAADRHRLGVRRLLLKSLPQQTAAIRDAAVRDRALLLAFHGIGSSAELADDIACAAADEAFELALPVRTRDAFAACLENGRARLVPAAERLHGLLGQVLTAHRDIRKRLEEDGRIAPRVREDVSNQLGDLIRPYLLTATPAQWRGRLPRYLQAVEMRLDKAAAGHPKDAESQDRVERAWRPLREWLRAYPADWPLPAPVARYRWLIEEYRISLFAQTLGTAVPVSAKRLEAAWREAQTS